MTVSDFEALIDNGRDIMFDVSGKHYTVLTWTEGGICIDEQDPNGGNEFYFISGEKLVDGFLVNGVPLRNLIDDVIITDYS